MVFDDSSSDPSGDGEEEEEGNKGQEQQQQQQQEKFTKSGRLSKAPAVCMRGVAVGQTCMGTCMCNVHSTYEALCPSVGVQLNVGAVCCWALLV